MATQACLEISVITVDPILLVVSQAGVFGYVGPVWEVSKPRGMLWVDRHWHLPSFSVHRWALCFTELRKRGCGYRGAEDSKADFCNHIFAFSKNFARLIFRKNKIFNFQPTFQITLCSISRNFYFYWARLVIFIPPGYAFPRIQRS